MMLVSWSGTALFDAGWTETQTKVLMDWARSDLRHPVIRIIVTYAHEDRLGGTKVALETTSGHLRRR